MKKLIKLSDQDREFVKYMTRLLKLKFRKFYQDYLMIFYVVNPMLISQSRPTQWIYCLKGLKRRKLIWEQYTD